MNEHNHESNGETGDEKYTVVARRYRPKTFAELVGQDTVAHALLRAIETHRIGHAYLFTGARGVGKTSTARIFAKALNASEDGTGNFDPGSEIALAIDSGDDMDVIEIDGASNRGIDEIRQLRANASIRPTRSKYKIYIIDEVHMLTTQAFNALLKTLEEPPGHVKFIFCTTDPEKIPITVLSRCQRFDFPPVHTDQILGRLRFICDTEGTQADDAALRLIARRAAGSMRDSQSLLEQLLSFGGSRITVADVHAMLGTADETRLASFASCMIDRNPSAALVELDQAVSAGVDPGQLAEQLLGYLRDMMAVSIGGPAELMRTANPNSVDQLRDAGKNWGTMTLLSAMQLLDETIVRMKHSVQSRILLEVALVQICSLVDLQALADVVKGLSQNQIPATAARPAARPAQTLPPLATSSAGLSSPQTPTINSAVSNSAVSNPEDSKKKDDVGSSALASAQVAKADASIESKDGSAAELTDTAPVINTLASKTPTSITSPETSPANTNLAQADLVETDLVEADHMPGTVSSAVALHGNSGVPKSPSAALPAQANSVQERSDAPSESTQNAATAVAATSAPLSVQPRGDRSALDIFREAALRLDGLVQQCGVMALEVIEESATRWRVLLAKEAAFGLQHFRSTENVRRLSETLKETIGQSLGFEFVLTDRGLPKEKSGDGSTAAALPPPAARPSVPQNQKIREAMTDPLVKRVMELFDGQILRVDEPPALAKTITAPHSAGEPTEVATTDDIAETTQ